MTTSRGRLTEGSGRVPEPHTPLKRARILRLVLVVGAAALGLSACGGSSGSDTGSVSPPATTSSTADGSASALPSVSSATAPDPCSLISAADLEAAYSLTFLDGAPDTSEPAAQQGFRVCLWRPNSGVGAFILQTSGPGDDPLAAPAAVFADTLATYPGTTDGGVGDKSALLPKEGGFLLLAGDAFVEGTAVSIGGLPAGGAEKLLDEVAAKL